DEELDVLVAVTSQAAVLVEAAQATASWERTQSALTELLEISSTLLEPGSVAEVLDRVCAGISSALAFDKVLVQLHDPAAGVHRCAASVGFSAGDKATETPTTDADLRRLLDAEFEINGCYLLPYAEGAARMSQASI